jgi:hypothetical protein
VKQVWAKAGASVTVVLTMLVAAAAPAGASTGATLADAQPWHYWIAYVLMASILGIVFIALPIGYYLRVWRLKHPRR